MTALERIKELEELLDHAPDWKFMCKAFNVMRGMALERGCTFCLPGMFEHKKEDILNREFEEKMK